MNVKYGFKRVFALFLVVVLALTGAPLAGFAELDFSGVADWFSTTAQAAEKFTEGDLTYTVENGEATITDCNDETSGELVIPDTLGGYPIVRIGGICAFANCKKLTCIIMPNSVTDIGIGAFSYCDSLKNVTLSSNLNRIEDFAFDNCISLSNVVIPKGVHYIGENAFIDCVKLTDIVIPKDISFIGLNSLGYYRSNGYQKIDGFTIYGYAGTAAEKYAIDNEFTFVDLTHKHTYVLITTKPATCTEVGTKTLQCSCGDSYDEVISALGHDFVTDLPERSATCTSFGNTKGYHCKRCDYTVSAKYIAPLGHKESTIPAMAPTCTKGGYTAGSYCLVCNDIITVPEDLPALGHDIVIDKPIVPTCTVIGFTEGKHCSRCDYVVKQKVIPAIGHDYTAFIDDGNGITHSKICKRKDCSVSVKNHAVVESHQIKAVAEKKATCTEDGNTAGTVCEICGYTTISVEKAVGKHDEVLVSGKAATCTEFGLTDGKKCMVCGEVTVKQEEIPPFGHKEETLVGKDSTCTERGLTEGKRCKVCGKITVKQKEMPAKGHIEKVIIGKEATCIESGLCGGKKCAVCGTITVKQDKIPARGHDFVIDVEAKGPTCTESGTTEGKHCTCCDYKVEAEEIEPLGHIDDDHDEKCDTCGDTVYIPIDNCKCNCHNKGIAKLFFKIGLIFQKIFKKNRICKCGVSHY